MANPKAAIISSSTVHDAVPLLSLPSSSGILFTSHSLKKCMASLICALTMVIGIQQHQLYLQRHQHDRLHQHVEELSRLIIDVESPSSKMLPDNVYQYNLQSSYLENNEISTNLSPSYSIQDNEKKVNGKHAYPRAHTRTPNKNDKLSTTKLIYGQLLGRFLQSTPSGNNTHTVPYTLATDYGIVGDGIADDTNALQAAIDAASASMFSSTGDDNKGGIVLLPKGLFYTTSSIILPAGVILQGQGYGSSPLSIQFDAGSSTIAYCGSTDYAVRIRGHGASMRDLAVYDKHCNGVYTDGGGILIDADGALVESVVLSNLLIYHFMGGPALHLHAQNFAGIAYSNFQNIRVRHAKEGIFMNAEDGSFVNSNSFLGGAISGGITDIALHAEGPGSCNDNKFYGIVIEPSQTNIAHVFVSGAKTNIRLLDVRLEGTEMMELNRPLIIIDDSSYGNVMNGMLGHNNIQADFNRNPEITFTTNKMVGVHPAPSNLLWNDGFHGLTADLTNGGGSMNGWSMPGQNWFGTILDASEDIYPNHRVLSIDYRNYGGAFKLQPANLPPSPAHSFATFGVFVRSSVPGALSVVMRSQNGNIISSSPNIGAPDKWEWVGMSSLYDKTAPYFYFNINGDVEITAPFFAYGQAPATPGTSFLPSSGGQLSGTLTLGVVDGFVPPGIKPLGANINEWTLPTSDGNHFIVDSSTSTGSATLVTRLNAVASTRFTKGTVITLLFPHAGITVKGSGDYIRLKNQQDFISTVQSSLSLLSGNSGTWTEVLGTYENPISPPPPPPPPPPVVPTSSPHFDNTKVFKISSQSIFSSINIAKITACKVMENIAQESCPNHTICKQTKCEEIQSPNRRLEGGLSLNSEYTLAVNSVDDLIDPTTEFIQNVNNETFQSQGFTAAGVTDGSFIDVIDVAFIRDFNYEISLNSSCTDVSFNDAQASEELKFCYNISDKFVNMNIFDQDCNTEVTDNALALAETLRWDGTPVETNDHIEFHINVLQNLIEASNVWTYNDATKKGNITFCMRLDLYADITKTFSVNFHETIATIIVDMSQGFTIESISANRDEAANISQSTFANYTLVAYQCEDALGTRSNKIMSQASILGLCIDLGSDAEGVQFDRVLDLSLTQDNGGSSTPIASGQRDVLTSASCDYNEGRRCFIQTVVVSTFFTPEAGNADITASGVVLLKFGRRRLNAHLKLSHDGHTTNRKKGINRFLEDAEDVSEEFQIVVATQSLIGEGISIENDSSKNEREILSDYAIGKLPSILSLLAVCLVAAYYLVRRKAYDQEIMSEELVLDEVSKEQLPNVPLVT